jgi:hypothetical protein
MRSTIVAVAIALAIFGCDSKKATPETTAKAHAPLVDLTTASGFGAVRTAFNAHKGEARFLALLSPT